MANLVRTEGIEMALAIAEVKVLLFRALGISRRRPGW
jgi:hypothetical protein